MTLTIWHNPRCSKSRGTLELLQQRGASPQIVEYLKTPPNEDEIARVLKLLGKPARALLRSGERVYAELNLANPTLSEQALIAAMARHPILIERPVVIAARKAVIGRPPEAALALL